MATWNLDLQQTEDAAPTATPPYQETIANLQAQMSHVLTGNAEVARRWVYGCGQMMTELMDFSGRRMQANFEILRRTAHCKDPGEALRIQWSGVETAVRSCAEEGGRLYSLCNKIGEDCMMAFDAPDDATADTQPKTPRAAA